MRRTEEPWQAGLSPGYLEATPPPVQQQPLQEHCAFYHTSTKAFTNTHTHTHRYTHRHTHTHILSSGLSPFFILCLFLPNHFSSSFTSLFNIQYLPLSLSFSPPLSFCVSLSFSAFHTQSPIAHHTHTHHTPNTHTHHTHTHTHTHTHRERSCKNG